MTGTVVKGSIRWPLVREKVLKPLMNQMLLRALKQGFIASIFISERKLICTTAIISMPISFLENMPSRNTKREATAMIVVRSETNLALL